MLSNHILNCAHLFVSVILNGLEDPCADIRALAIQCTGHLQLDRKSEDYDSQGHHGILDLTFSRLLLHLEDPFMKQRPIILGKSTISILSFFLYYT